MRIRDLFKANIWTISNLLTVIRISCLPFIVFFLYMEKVTGDRNYITWQMSFFAVVMLSDFFDGMLARKLNQVTELGQLLDPVADKICLLILGSSLIYYKGLPWWILAIIIVREIFVVVSALFLFYRRDIEVAPNIFGKIGIALMALTAVFYIINLETSIYSLELKKLTAIASLVFYITGSVLYVKTYSVYCKEKTTNC